MASGTTVSELSRQILSKGVSTGDIGASDTEHTFTADRLDSEESYHRNDRPRPQGVIESEASEATELAVLLSGLRKRLLECALATGPAGDRQLRRPSRDAANERCGALATRDFDWCTLPELSK
jgi:hypothetical protein